MEDKNYTYEREIDIRDLLLVLWRKAKTIILVAILFGVLVGGFRITTFKPKSMYSAIARVYVERDFSNMNFDNLLKNSDNLILNEGTMTAEYYKKLLSDSLKEDYKVIVTSNTVLQEVKDDLNLDIDYNVLLSKVSVQSLGTSIVEIKVKDKDDQLAKNIVNALAESSANRIKEVMSVKNVKLVDEGFVTDDLSAEQLIQLSNGSNIEDILPEQTLTVVHILKFVIIGGIVGCFLAAVIIVFLYIFDKTIKDKKDIEFYLDLPVIGTIPTISGMEKTVLKNKKKKQKRFSQYSK